MTIMLIVIVAIGIVVIAVNIDMIVYSKNWLKRGQCPQNTIPGIWLRYGTGIAMRLRG